MTTTNVSDADQNAAIDEEKLHSVIVDRGLSEAVRRVKHIAEAIAENLAVDRDKLKADF